MNQIGPVAPHPQHNCIKRVTVRNIINEGTDLRSVYVSTDVGNNGTGEIRDILFENINTQSPRVSNIYIGPEIEDS